MTLPRVLIVQSRFYNNIEDELLHGVLLELGFEPEKVYDQKKMNIYHAISKIEHNLHKTGFAHFNEHITLARVNGALEIPQAINLLSHQFDVVIAIGCVIKGETAHFEYVCSETIRLINDIIIKRQVPFGNAIITAYTTDQAVERSDHKQKNVGGFAARAAMQVWRIKSNRASTESSGGMETQHIKPSTTISIA